MGFRVEKAFLGERQIPDEAYYGIQTLRGMENFHITGMPMSREPYFVKAFGYVKKAAAMANRDLGLLEARIADAIIRACDRLIAGEMLDQLVTDFIQGDAGTSTNMNANEVIANLALESLGYNKGEYQHVNPNDHVNFGQSTNDVYPTAFHLGLILRVQSVDAARGVHHRGGHDDGQDDQNDVDGGRGGDHPEADHARGHAVGGPLPHRRGPGCALRLLPGAPRTAGDQGPARHAHGDRDPHALP